MGTPVPSAKAPRPLLPAGGPPEPTPEHPPDPASKRRQLVATACENCRRRKAKALTCHDLWSGEKPSCGLCKRRNETCVYELERGKIRYGALAKKHKDLEKADADLQELVRALQHRPDIEASDILHRLRSETNPLAVLSHIRDGELLLQASSGKADGSSKDHLAEQAKSTGAQDSKCPQCGIGNHECRCSDATKVATLTRSLVQMEKTTRNDTNVDNMLGANLTRTEHLQNFSISEDEAQTRAVKRKYVEIERRNEVYNKLYSSIANADEAVAAAIFRRLRNGDDAHKILNFVQNGDPKATPHLDTPTKFRQDLLNNLVSSTASLREIIKYIDISDREIPATAPPMRGLFEPLRNRTIDLTILHKVLRRKQIRPLEDVDRTKQAQEPPRISAASSDDDNEQRPSFL
ncbi:MAG: hypothetical protein Q9181_007749, partial [Wetmoreana brouardii]